MSSSLAPASAAELANPGFLSRFVRDAILRYYKKQGWTAFNDAQGVRKAVIIAAPHTSNWDFIYYLGATRTLGLVPRFMGKTALFRWPMRRFMLEMGGVPVDRSARRDMVSQMADQFAANEDFFLTVGPEGTRSGATKWKTGFYHIALKAGVPIIPGVINYRTKRVGLTAPVMPTGDYRADMEKILAAYANGAGEGKNPDHSIVGKAPVDAFV